MNKQITPTLNPFSVLINWSESNEFNEGQLYDFMDFEHKALDVAKQNPLGGYDKTNVTVTFENGDKHQCRKHVFWNEDNKEKYAPLGEIAIPSPAK